MKYRVHLYAVVRVPVDVEADDPLEAAVKAEESIDLHQDFRRGEYAEEIESVLVDSLDANGKLIQSQELTSDGDNGWAAKTSLKWT